ncbi:MAG: ABC transporter permease [Dehalococcoidia bacterium]
MLAEGRIGAGLSETSVKCGSTAVEDSGWRSILCVLSEGRVETKETVGVSSTSSSSRISDRVKAESLWSKSFRRFRQNRGAVIGLGVIIFLVLVAIGAPWITRYDPLFQDLTEALLSPSAEHFFGTDQYGRDVYTRVVYGARISPRAGLISAGISCLLGIPLGLLAAYYMGWMDALIMRLVDVMLAFPGMLLALAIMAVLGPSLTNTLIAAGLAHVPDYIRITRGSVLSVKEMDYVTAARAIGAPDRYIMVRHILPNVLLPLIVFTSLEIAGAILVVAGLSFLGLGAQPPTPEWGAMLTVGRDYVREAWWLPVFPGLAITLTVLAMNLVGEGMRDALDPRLTIKKQ